MSSGHPDSAYLPTSGENLPAEGIDLLAVLAALIAEWRLAVTAAAVTCVLGLIIIFTLQTQYVAQCSVLPQSGRTDNDFASLFSTHSPAALYVGFLQSRSVKDAVIHDLNLEQEFKTTSMDTTRSELSAKTTFTVGTDSLVVIKVKDPSAVEAAKIANAYLDGLERLNSVMSQESGRQTEQFFQGQLQEERDALDKAEANLEKTQQSTGIVQPQLQTQIGLSAIASTRAQIDALEVQLAGLHLSETDQNPQVRQIQSQISQLRAAEHMQEAGSVASPVGAAPSATQLPRTTLDLTRAEREVSDRASVVNSLTSQYEVARLSEEFTKPNFQIVDRAVVPEHKSWPPRKLLVALLVFFAGLVGLVSVILKLSYRRLVENPSNQPSLQVIRHVFGRS